MTRWQYAWVNDLPQTTVGFSHPQPGLVAEFAQLLGPAAIAPQSNEWQMMLDPGRVNLAYVSGLLGDRGWEMLAVVSRMQQGGMMQTQLNMMQGQLQTIWYFKRPVEG
jgi:hypothetical protein